MKFLVVIIIILFGALLFACDDQSYIEEKEISQSSKLADDNVFKDYESALDKAKSVEQTIIDAAEKRQKEMHENGY